MINASSQELEELLRSAHCIALRQGRDTAWDRFADSCQKLGVGSVTARTYKVLPSDEPVITPGKTSWEQRLASAILDAMDADHHRTGDGTPEDPKSPNWKQMTKWVIAALARVGPEKETTKTQNVKPCGTCGQLRPYPTEPGEWEYNELVWHESGAWNRVTVRKSPDGLSLEIVPKGATQPIWWPQGGAAWRQVTI